MQNRRTAEDLIRRATALTLETLEYVHGYATDLVYVASEQLTIAITSAPHQSHATIDRTFDILREHTHKRLDALQATLRALGIDPEKTEHSAADTDTVTAFLKQVGIAPEPKHTPEPDPSQTWPAPGGKLPS